MDHHQRELRRAAAKAFVESLDQLAVCFEAESPAAQPVRNVRSVSASEIGNLHELEDAAADIEQFMQAKIDL